MNFFALLGLFRFAEWGLDAAPSWTVKWTLHPASSSLAFLGGDPADTNLPEGDTLIFKFWSFGFNFIGPTWLAAFERFFQQLCLLKFKWMFFFWCRFYCPHLSDILQATLCLDQILPFLTMGTFVSLRHGVLPPVVWQSAKHEAST